MVGKPAQDPYWWEAVKPRAVPATAVDAKCDVTIVGAGYAGLSAALVLARTGRSVQVFDKLRPGEGASSRNGGIASGTLRVSFGGMIKTVGLEAAKNYYGEGMEARKGLEAFIADEGIECDFKTTGHFTAAMRASHYDELGREADLLNKHLGTDITMVPKSEVHSEIGSDLYCGGMVRDYVAGLHPAKFHAGLLDAALAAGIVVHGNTAVTGVRREGTGFQTDTARGQVSSGQVIVATNGYTDKSDRWLRRRLVPIASRIIATEPLGAETMARLMPKNRMLGETRIIYHYYRPSPDGSRILFGGRQRKGSDGYSMSLRSEMAEVFPELADVALSHSWAGFVAYNRDYLPRLFCNDGIHYGTGFCGSGVVWAWWLGAKLAASLTGARNSDTAFRCAPPKAVPFYNGTPWFMPITMAWFRMRDRLGR